MPIPVQCDSCDHRFKVKDTFAGRRVKCPECQKGVAVPASDDEADGEEELFADAPVKASRSKKRRQPAAGADAPWYRRHWHWLVVAGVLVLAVIPTVGLIIAGLVALVGMMIALVCGLIPIFKIIVGAPGTVLLMIVSRSARFEMMEAPDTHPYKQLVRNAGSRENRGLMWRGVLLMLSIVPAAFIQGYSGEFFRRMKQNAAPAPAPPFGPGFRPGAGQMPGAMPGQAPGQMPGHERGPAGQPGMPGMPGPQQGGQRNAADQDRIFVVTITYKAYKGPGSPTEAAEQLMTDLPGYQADTVKIDEGAQTIQFEHKGPLLPPNLFPFASKRGFSGFSFRASSKPQ